MIIKLNNSNIIASKSNDNNHVDFQSFLVDIANNHTIQVLYQSDDMIKVSDEYGYYENVVKIDNRYKLFCITVQDYVDYCNTGNCLFSFETNQSQDELYNLVHYGSRNPECILYMDENFEQSLYFTFNDALTKTFDIWTIAFCNENGEVEYSIDFPTKQDCEWQIEISKLDIYETETYNDCTRDAYIFNSDMIDSDTIGVNVNEHIAYTRAM